MNNINYNPNQRFYDFSLSKDDLNISCFITTLFEEQLTYFVSKLEKDSKQLLPFFNKQQIQMVIFQKRLNNLNAIQNSKIYCNGTKDGYIDLQDYKDYYHLIFEYDLNKLNQIKQLLHNKYNIENVNLYQFDQKNLIYIFDKDSNFEVKINSTLFSNLNNRINNYKKQNLIYEQKCCSTDQIEHLCFKTLKYQSPQKFWHCYDSYGSQLFLYKFNNIFDQNWYNRFVQNMKLFLNNQLSK